MSLRKSSKNIEDQKLLELETLLDVTSSLMKFTSINDFFNDVIIQVVSLLNASSGIIFINKPNAEIFEPISYVNINEDALRGYIITRKRGLFSKLMNIESALLIDSSEDLIFKKVGAQFGIIAPIKDNDKLLGAIVVFDKETRTNITVFNQFDVKLITAISTQISIAYKSNLLIHSLLESKNFNENLLDSMPTAITTINLLDEIEVLNNSTSSIFNIDKNDAIKNHYEFVFAQFSIVIEMIKSSIENSSYEKQIGVIVDVQGKQKILNISVSPMVNKQSVITGYILSVEDITDVNKIKNTFKKYVSKNIVEKILTEDKTTLGGSYLDVTILFSDIRGFTSISESLEPIEVVNTLNEYFDLMIDIVLKNNGTLDKIIGDALMVLFGAPTPMEGDTIRAIKTAFLMVKALDQLNQKRVLNNLFPIHIGIGVNCGQVIAGNIGSKEQMNYTVIGDAVNIASRLCSTAKAGQIIISEEVKHRVESYFKTVPLEKMYLKGKSKPIQVYEVLDVSAS